MSIPLETRAETARQAIRGLGLEGPGLNGFLAKVDRALSRPSAPQQEAEIRFIEQDLARWTKSEKGR